jgi:glycosyltransferase involved in cell wall biosynthesis
MTSKQISNPPKSNKKSLQILILCSGSLCSNPRPLKEAIALQKAGHTVTVLSVFETEQRTLCDAELLAAYAVRHVIIRPPKNCLRGLVRRGEVWLSRRLIRYTKIQLPAVLGPVRAMLAQARQMASDLTIVHNEGPFWVGQRLLDEGRTVAADFEDWYSEDLLPEARVHRPLRLLRTLERDLLQRAVYTTTTSQALSDSLHRAYGGKMPIVITNSFPLEPLPLVRVKQLVPEFFWFSQTIGPGRGLEEFVRGWVLCLNPSRLTLLGHPADGYREQLFRLIPPQLHSQIQIMPPVPPNELHRSIARYDIGLSLEKNTPESRNLTITNKILQYLNAGLAVVASDTAGQREVRTQALSSVEIYDMRNPSELADKLDQLIGDPSKIGAMQFSAREAAETVYNWGRESSRLLSLVEQLTGT